MYVLVLVFFFKQKTAYEMRISDWSSDVCSSDLEANPAANASAFTDGWFRTGDLGRLDAEGYLTIAGRIKEIVNREGEKISPREVDEALLEIGRASCRERVCQYV